MIKINEKFLLVAYFCVKKTIYFILNKKIFKQF